MHNQIEIKCNTCGGALLTWTEKYAEGTTLCGKCVGCKKLWRMEFDKQGEMLDATVEDYED
jgi:hypothetical protein